MTSVVVIEHDMQIIAASDWVIEIGPGAGDEGDDTNPDHLHQKWEMTFSNDYFISRNGDFV
jgi:excinuclease UvrABC ATPase subunit